MLVAENAMSSMENLTKSLVDASTKVAKVVGKTSMASGLAFDGFMNAMQVVRESSEKIGARVHNEKTLLVSIILFTSLLLVSLGIYHSAKTKKKTRSQRKVDLIIGLKTVSIEESKKGTKESSGIYSIYIVYIESIYTP